MLASTRALRLLHKPQDGRLVNPQEFVKSELKKKRQNIVLRYLLLLAAPHGQVASVFGSLAYHHYMQDDFDDAGWGCAYRTFQTLCSWLCFQGFTDKAPPTHREMQQVCISLLSVEPKICAFCSVSLILAINRRRLLERASGSARWS